MAVTEPQSVTPALVEFIEQAGAWLTVRARREMTGGASFNEVFLDDVAVSDDRRLD